MICTDRDEVADRCRIMSLHGISRDAWKRYTASGSWYYEIEEAGFKYNLTDLAAAIGLVQLGRAEEMRRAREQVAWAYGERLAGGPLAQLIELPAAPGLDTVHAWHLYPIRIAASIDRAAVIDTLANSGIGTSVHFIPLHMHPYYRRTYGYSRDDLPVAADEYEREISLPIYPDLSEAEIDRVCDSLASAMFSATRT